MSEMTEHGGTGYDLGAYEDDPFYDEIVEEELGYEGELPFLGVKDFPPPSRQVGFSIYKGILVIWDEDIDGRVLRFIEELPTHLSDKLVLVAESEGVLFLRWDSAHLPGGVVPASFKDGQMVDVGNDSWDIQESRVLATKRIAF